MSRLRRRAKMFVAFVAILFVGSTVVYLISGSRGVPTDFREARSRGALISQEIVALARESEGALEEINRLDREYRFAEALDKTVQLAEHNEALRQKAVALSREVEVMTKAVANVSNFEAQRAAVESISSRLALISRLITYSNNYDELIETLRAKFMGLSTAKKRSVSTIISEINSEINAINNFDRQAQESIERFDKITGETS